MQDPSMVPPFVPASVFPNVQSTTYWSVSAPVKVSLGVSVVHVVDGRVNGGDTSYAFPAWCVRGGVNTEQY